MLLTETQGWAAIWTRLLRLGLGEYLITPNLVFKDIAVVWSLAVSWIKYLTTSPFKSLVTKCLELKPIALVSSCDERWIFITTYTLYAFIPSLR